MQAVLMRDPSHGHIKHITCIRALCVLVASVTLSACLVQPLDSNCETASCVECLERSGCGWCRDLGCLPGDSTGDDELLCPSEDWGFATCPSDCSVLTDCTSCAAANGCGWCLDRCARGTADGPRAGTCAAAAWSYATCDSREDPCRRYTSCAGCHNNGCGWCGERDGCFSGTPDEIGTAEYPASSVCEEWTMSRIVCDQLRCQKIEECDTCMETDECEWCGGDGGFCFDREANRANGTLPGGVDISVLCPEPYAFGRFSYDACPIDNNCERFNGNCGGCVAAPGCVGCRDANANDDFFCAPDHPRACDGIRETEIVDAADCSL